MGLTIRPIRPEDAEECACVAYAAHQAVARAHNFPPEHTSVDVSLGMMRMQIGSAHVFGVVAERDGRVVGSNFLNRFTPAAAAVGPLTVLPAAEGGVGRQLMLAVLDEARAHGPDAVRLVQSPSHLRSLALYAKLGFAVREPLALLQVRSPGGRIAGRHVRPARPSDIPACNQLCRRVHGLERELELVMALDRRQAAVVEQDGRITGYATGIGFFGYAVAEATDDVKALIASAEVIQEPGLFVPIRDGELLRWLLGEGFRLAWPALLMTSGPYCEPAGAYLPSIAF